MLGLVKLELVRPLCPRPLQPGLLGFFIFYIDDFFSFVELLRSTVAVICNRFAVRA